MVTKIRKSGRQCRLWYFSVSFFISALSAVVWFDGLEVLITFLRFVEIHFIFVYYLVLLLLVCSGAFLHLPFNIDWWPRLALPPHCHRHCWLLYCKGLQDYLGLDFEATTAWLKTSRCRALKKNKFLLKINIVFS